MNFCLPIKLKSITKVQIDKFIYNQSSSAAHALFMEYVQKKYAVKEQNINRTVAVNSAKSKYINGFSMSKKLLYYQSRHYLKEMKHSRRVNIDSIPSVYSPLFTGNQSSGSGKSRSIMELFPFQIILTMSAKNNTGFPKPCKALEHLLNLLFKHLSVKVKNLHRIINFIQNFILRIIDMTLTHYESDREKLFQSEQYPGDLLDLDILFEGLEDYLKSDDTRCQNINNSCPYLSQIDPIPYNDKAAVTENSVKDKLERVVECRIDYLCRKFAAIESDHEKRRKIISLQIKSIPPVLLLLDEAQHLLANNEDKYSVINSDGELWKMDVHKLFRRSLRISNFLWKHCWGFTVSTNTALVNFFPTLEEDPSLRKWGPTTTVPPFIFDGNYNVFASEYLKIGSDSCVCISSCEYLKSWARFLHVASCGRPLYYSHLITEMNMNLEELNHLKSKQFTKYWPSNCENGFTTLYDLILRKAAGGLTTEFSYADLQIYLRYPDLAYSMLSAATGMHFIPATINKNELVKSHMAWVVSADTFTQEYNIVYPAEGSYNSIIAHTVSVNAHLVLNSKCLQEILFSPSSKRYFDTSQISEIVSHLYFLFIIFDTPSINTAEPDTSKSHKAERPKITGNITGIETIGIDDAVGSSEANSSSEGSSYEEKEPMPSINTAEPDTLELHKAKRLKITGDITANETIGVDVAVCSSEADSSSDGSSYEEKEPMPSINTAEPDTLELHKAKRLKITGDITANETIGVDVAVCSSEADSSSDGSSYEETEPINLKKKSMQEMADTIFAPRYVKSFLSKFIDHELVDEFISLNSNLKNSLVSFSYFQSSLMAKNSNPVNISKAMFYRGSARAVPGKNSWGADLLIPIAVSSGEYGLILVQIKHYEDSLFQKENFVPYATTLEFVRKLRLSYVFKGCKNDACPVIRLLINFNASISRRSFLGRDKYGSYLILETDCMDFDDKTKNDILRNSVRKLNESFDGKCNEVNADFDVPPCKFHLQTNVPFNAAYYQGKVDNDSNVLDQETIIYRPSYNFDNLSEYPEFIPDVRN